MSTSDTPMKYVGFCDVLGFSSAVINDFDATIALYRGFRDNIKQWPFSLKAQVSVYSDSILVIADELPTVVSAIVALNWSALTQNWLIRGGVAYGRYWEDKEDGNLFVVSDALVKAVEIEKSIKVPAVVLSKEIRVGIEAWVPRFAHGAIQTGLLHFDGHTLVNPFNEYWFASAATRARQLLEAHPGHKEKYEWFLSLVQAVANDEILVPEEAFRQMLELGILQKRS